MSSPRSAQKAFFISAHAGSPLSPSCAFAEFFRGAQETFLHELLEVEVSPPSIRVVNELLNGEEQFAFFSRENSRCCSSLDQLAHLFPALHLLHDASFDEAFLDRHCESIFSHELQKELRTRFGSDLDVLADCFIRGWGKAALARSFRWTSELESTERRGNVLRLVSTKSLQRFFPDALYCPIPLATVPLRMSRSETRKALGVSDQEFLIAFAPQHEMSDRAQMIEEIFIDFASSDRPATLLRICDSDFCGAPQPEGSVASQEKRIIRASCGSRDELTRLIAASDVFVGTRVDEYLGMPIAALTALQQGVPTLISKTRAMEEIPLGLALRIRPGFSEKQEIYEALSALFALEDLRESLRRAAPPYISANHSPARVAEFFQSLFATCLPKLQQMTEGRRVSAIKNRSELLKTREQNTNALDGLLTPQISSAFFQASKDFAW